MHRDDPHEPCHRRIHQLESLLSDVYLPEIAMITQEVDGVDVVLQVLNVWRSEEGLVIRVR